MKDKELHIVITDDVFKLDVDALEYPQLRKKFGINIILHIHKHSEVADREWNGYKKENEWAL